MGKRTPKSAKAHADRLCAAHIKSIGYCEHCGATPNQAQMHWAHWISRRYAWTRTHEANSFCLCAKCHRWFTDHPTEFSRWAIGQRGEDVYQGLLRLSQRREKFDWFAEVERLKGLDDRKVNG